MVLNRLHTKRINEDSMFDQQHQGEIVKPHSTKIKTDRKRPASCLSRWTSVPRAKVGGFILVSECLPGIISAPSKVVVVTMGSKPDLRHWY
jgi:hypothetical protein